MLFSQKDVIQIFEWYGNLESRLQPILEVMPVADMQSLTKIVSPRSVPILIESCSILDSILRTMLPERMLRPNGKPITRKGANINDFYRELEHNLHLTLAVSIVLTPLPFILSPFDSWSAGTPAKLNWWIQYNHLKHDRLKWSSKVTLLDTIESLCALHQLMTRIPSIVAMSFRFNWIELSGYNPDILLEGLPNKIGETLQSFLSYTKIFCTPLTNPNWTNLEDIHPVLFGNSKRLMHFMGREQ